MNTFWANSLRKSLRWIQTHQQDFALWLATFILVGFVSYLIPKTIWNTEPATGGDTGSHFYPLYVLVKHGLPEWSLRTWNPGNLMGEPHLLHYFPGPFLVMAALSLFLPLGLAFNLGTILPLLFFPVCVFIGVRSLRLTNSQSFFAACGSLIFLFNESYSMWGGNANSLLAGQFAHLYALNLFFLFIAAIQHDLARPNRLYLPTLLGALVAICHSYVFLLIPFFFLGLLIHQALQAKEERIPGLFKYLFISGLVILSLSVWFWGPQVANAPWTTGNAMKWHFDDFWGTVFPPKWRELSKILFLLLPFILFWAGRRPDFAKKMTLLSSVCLTLIAVSFVFFYVFPKLGLVDARAIPHIQLFSFLLLFGLLGLTIHFFFRPRTAQILLIVLGLGSLYWAQTQVKNFPYWVQWNYSSWSKKTLYKETQDVFQFLRGDFSQPRVVNEHHPSLNAAGTTRVFEMTPYFAGRASLESLYQEATHTAPLTHWVQARISEKPSCPIRGWDCPSQDFKGLANQLSLIGVQDLILTSPQAFEKIKESTDFSKVFSSESFQIHRLKKKVSLVEVLQSPVEDFQEPYQRRFYDWFKNYNPTESVFLIKNLPPEWTALSTSGSGKNCLPEVVVDYNRIRLFTNCPERIHYLKFTYHPAWTVSNGVPLKMVSPGFMALVPKDSQVELRFGPQTSWVISLFWSLATLVALCVFARARYKISTQS